MEHYIAVKTKFTDPHFLAGMLCLERAEGQAFQDTILLEQAMAHLVLSIQSHPRAPEPLVGLAYLLLLLGDKAEARVYLDLALEFAPENEAAQALNVFWAD